MRLKKPSIVELSLEGGAQSLPFQKLLSKQYKYSTTTDSSCSRNTRCNSMLCLSLRTALRAHVSRGNLAPQDMTCNLYATKLEPVFVLLTKPLCY